MSSRLVLVEARSEDTGVYYCVVSNTLYDMAYSVTSDEVNLSVTGETIKPPNVVYVYRATLFYFDVYTLRSKTLCYTTLFNVIHI